MSTPILGQTQPKYVYGAVRSVEDQALAHKEIVIEGFGKDITTDSGVFKFPLQPPLKIGYPVTFHISGWVIIDPCVLARGRTYLPNPEAEQISIKAVRLNDRKVLLANSLQCIIEEQISDFNSPSGIRVEDLCNPQFRGRSVRAAGQIEPQAKSLHLKPDELVSAISHWSSSAEEPFQKALAAFYDQEYAQASRYAAASLSTTDQHKSRALVLLARAEYEKGNCVAAEIALREALSLRDADLQVRAALAFVIRGQGRFAEAAAIFSELGRDSDLQSTFELAVEFDKTKLGPMHPRMAKNHKELAEFYRSRRRYERAEPEFLAVLAVDNANLGEDHPTIAKDMISIAANLTSLGKHVQAETYYRKALEVNRHVLGTDNPDVAANHRFLANNLRLQNRNVAAASELKEALRIDQIVYSENDPIIMEDLRSLREALHAAGEAATAEETAKQIIHLNDRIVASLAFQDRLVLAEIHRSQRKYGEAEQDYLGLIEIAKLAFGESDLKVASLINNLAECYYTEMKYSDAEMLYKRALEIYKDLKGPTDTLRVIYRNLGRALRALNRHSEAIFFEDQARGLDPKMQ